MPNLERFFDQLPDLLCIVDQEDRFVRVSRSWKSVLGWEPSELEGRPVTDLMHPDDVEASLEVVRKLRGGSRSVSFSNRYRTPTGAFRTLAWNTAGRDEAGLVYASARDVTQDQLTIQELSDVIDGANAGTWRWNVQTGETIFNERWAEIIGYTLAELQPSTIETWMSFAHPDDLAESEARLNAHFNGELDHYQCEARMRHRDGRWVWVLDLGRVVSWTSDGKPEWVAGTHIDITERKTIEAELQQARHAAESANRAKSQFLANMSHEIRTPLNGVMGMAQLMARTPLNERQAYYLTVLRNSGAALLDIIEDVLDVSRIEAGMMTLSSAPFSIADMLDTTLSAVKGAAESKNLQLHVQLDPGLPDYVMGDKHRMRQIVLNLLGNAVKFTSKGSVRLSAHWADGVFTLDVIDTGSGIPEAAQSMIFDRFAQANASMTREVEGSGLGLSISRDIAAMAGGSVELVSSRLGEGSHFRLKAPLPMASQRALLISEEDASTPRIELTGCKVLVVEDNLVNRQVITTYLSQTHAEVYEAENGEAAASMLRRDIPFDAIVMDLHMPKLSGLDVLQTLKTADARTPPVIMVTADVTPEAQEAMMRNGASSVLSKPLNLDKLALEIRKACDVHSPAQQMAGPGA